MLIDYPCRKVTEMALFNIYFNQNDGLMPYERKFFFAFREFTITRV